MTNQFHYQEDALSILMSDSLGQRLWRFGEQDLMFVTPSKFDSGYNHTTIPLPVELRNNLGVAGFENITNVGKEKYLIGSSNGYVTLDLDRLKQKEHIIYIDQVKKYSYGTTSQSVALDTLARFGNEENNLLFSFSVPEYDKYAAVEYQYRLEGLYDSWSNWSTRGGRYL